MSITRRDTLAMLASAALLASTSSAQGQSGKRFSWPKGFLWGVATAGHQIEGNNVGSDYWLLEHLAETDFREPSGDACDSWNRWREDIALVASMGLTTYRFSVEWARIEPEPGKFSAAALAQYRLICLACHSAGIMPIVTLHHFVSPRWVAAMGGWEAPELPELFARYAARVARDLGDLTPMMCTMNEPNAQVTSFVLRDGKPSPKEPAMRAAAMRLLGSDRFGAYFMGDAIKVRDGCLRAHRLARAAIKSVAPQVKTGLTLALQDLQPGPGGAPLHARVFDEARRPFYEACAGDDFIGVQPYIRLITGPTGYLPTPPGLPMNRDGRDASPDVLPAVVREVAKHCRAPILVSEHGIDTLDDAQRAQHLAASVEALKGCVTEGVPLLGYIHWSLLDNFEWRSGYEPRFGLVAVDRQTFKRSPKPSAAAYRQLVRRERG